MRGIRGVRGGCFGGGGGWGRFLRSVGGGLLSSWGVGASLLGGGGGYFFVFFFFFFFFLCFLGSLGGGGVLPPREAPADSSQTLDRTPPRQTAKALTRGLLGDRLSQWTGYGACPDGLRPEASADCTGAELGSYTASPSGR